MLSRFVQKIYRLYVVISYGYENIGVNINMVLYFDTYEWNLKIRWSVIIKAYFEATQSSDYMHCHCNVVEHAFDLGTRFEIRSIC